MRVFKHEGIQIACRALIRQLTRYYRCGIEFAPYAEPPDDVVTEASPSSFHGDLLLSAASKLPESTSLFDPGVRELSDL